MIYTVTLNPALDRTLKVNQLVEDDTIRVVSEEYYAGGKGIDVSRVIKRLGHDSVALGLIGGYAGLHLEGLLINAGVLTNFTKISGETRTNIIVKESETGRQFIISAAGPSVTPTEIGQFYQHILQIHSMDYLVLSGSLPRGMTPNMYGQLVLTGRNKGAFVVLDSDGNALKESVISQPSCIKPNRHELSRLVGREVTSEGEILEACDEMHGRGVAMVLVSRGKDGLILSTRDQKIKAVAPSVEADSTVGAGDSVVAGFVLAHSRDQDLVECLRLGCAAGTATAVTPGTELCHRAEVEAILPKVRVTFL